MHCDEERLKGKANPICAHGKKKYFVQCLRSDSCREVPENPEIIEYGVVMRLPSFFLLFFFLFLESRFLAIFEICWVDARRKIWSPVRRQRFGRLIPLAKNSSRARVLGTTEECFLFHPLAPLLAIRWTS